MGEPHVQPVTRNVPAFGYRLPPARRFSHSNGLTPAPRPFTASAPSLAPFAGLFLCMGTSSPARLKNRYLPKALQNQKSAHIITKRANFINKLDFIMNTRETLILKALQFKELHTSGSSMTGDLVDHILEQNPEKADELTKNVCARIPLQLAQEMEAIGGMLDLNKREIITMALHDFLDKAKAVVDEFDALPEGGV